MPLFDYRCTLGHVHERFFHTTASAPTVVDCRQCDRLAPRCWPLVNCPQFFSESNGRVIQNLDPTRVIHSPAEHRQLMKDKGVDIATDWGVSMRPSRM